MRYIYCYTNTQGGSSTLLVLLVNKPQQRSVRHTMFLSSQLQRNSSGHWPNFFLDPQGKIWLSSSGHNCPDMSYFCTRFMQRMKKMGTQSPELLLLLYLGGFKCYVQFPLLFNANSKPPTIISVAPIVVRVNFMCGHRPFFLNLRAKCYSVIMVIIALFYRALYSDYTHP